MERAEILAELEWYDDEHLYGELNCHELHCRLEAIFRNWKEYEIPDKFSCSVVRVNKILNYRGFHFKVYVYSICEEGEDGPLPAGMGRVRILLPDHSETSPWYFALTNGECISGNGFIERDDSGMDGSLRERTESLLNKAMADIDWFWDKAESDIRKHAERMLGELNEAKEGLEVE